MSPIAVHAQQLIGPVIGYLNNLSVDADPQLLAAFHDGLNSQGYAEGRNVAVVYRWADSHNARLPELAADLIRQLAVSACSSWFSTRATPSRLRRPFRPSQKRVQVPSW